MGFAIGSAYWGTAVFEDGPRIVLKSRSTTIGLHRLEGACCCSNGRGNGALGNRSRAERILRQSFLKTRVSHQMLWQSWPTNGRHVDRVGGSRSLKNQHNGHGKQKQDPAARPCPAFVFSAVLRCAG